MRSVLGWISQVVVWLVILLVLVALAAAVLVPRIAGGTPYTVLTGSMAPTYPPGTLVVVKPTTEKQIQVGDVITYQRESGRSTVVTHRVIGVGTRLDGEKVFTTQGDANDAPDPAPVRVVQVRGKLWYSVPYLGYVNTALNGRQRQTAVYVVSGLLIGYAAFMVVGAVRDRRRKKSQVEDTNQVDEQDLSEEVPRDHAQVVDIRASRSHGVRNAALAVLGLIALGVVYRLIRARKGRSGDHADTN